MISRQELLQLSTRHRMNLNTYNVQIENDKVTIYNIESWRDEFTRALENKLGRRLTCTYSSNNTMCTVGLLSVVLEKHGPSTASMYALFAMKAVMTLVVPVLVVSCYLYTLRHNFFVEFLLYKGVA